MDWQNLATTSPYQTAVAVDQSLRRGDVAEAAAGIQELVESLSRSDKRALRSHLVRLMAHVIKWRLQPEKKTRSWRTSIRNARREIAGIQEDTPSLTRAVIESMWDDCLESGRDEAAGDMEQDLPPLSLTWEDVFVTEYELE